MKIVFSSVCYVVNIVISLIFAEEETTSPLRIIRNNYSYFEPCILIIVLHFNDFIYFRLLNK